MIDEDDDLDALELLRASVAELAVLQHSADALLETKHWELASSDASIVAPDSGGLWGAYARVVLPVVYTTIERIVASLARDRVRDFSDATDLLSLLEAPMSPRLPRYQKEISPPKNNEAPSTMRLEQDLASAFESAGFSVDPCLVKRLVALKQLRNECAHTSPRNQSRSYIVEAGFAQDVRSLSARDILMALDVMEGVLGTFAQRWPLEDWSRQRNDILSDLPIFISTLIQRIKSVAPTCR